MKKLFLVSLISAALVVAGQPAFADHRGHGYYKQHHYKGHHKRHHYKHHRKHRRHHGHHHHRKRKGVDGDDIIVAAGILGGAVVLGSLLSRPTYAQPAPQYYAPAPSYSPPPRQPYCVVDDVYRYLPDGRIQWGERTTCY